MLFRLVTKKSHGPRNQVLFCIRHLVGSPKLTTKEATSKQYTLKVKQLKQSVLFSRSRVLMFHETKSRETSGLEGKQN